MKKNNNMLNNSLWTKVISSLMVFVFAMANVFALPGITATNLQTTAGVNVTANGNSLTFTTPDKAVLTWQAFGSGTDTIGVNDALSYVLPSKNASVLNIVAGGASTTIDGSVTSNGNVFVLNPNGLLVGGGARIETNRLVLSTSDNTTFASFLFQQEGRLPSQAGLGTVSAGTVMVNSGAIISVGENITMLSKNVGIAGAVIQGGLTINADGNVTVGSAGLAYVNGDLVVNNANGTTTLGSAGNNTIIAGNATVTGTANSTFTALSTGTVQAKNLTVTGGAITSDKVSTNGLTVNGTNITVAVGSSVINPVVNVTGNGTVSVTAPAALITNVTNTSATAATTVTSVGALTLGRVQHEGTGVASFTGASVSDTDARVFVYGPASFTATTGNVTINKGKHSFGPVSVFAVAGEANVVEDATTQLNVVNTTKFALRSAENVFQTPVTGVVSSPLSTVTAAENIALTAIVANAAGSYTLAGNDVALVNAGAVSLNATARGNVSITSTGAITLGNVTSAGTLTVNTANPITQAADTKVNVYGATSLVGSALTLTNLGNTLGALTVDVGAAGTASVTEETTLNIAGLRAANATLRSNDSVITSGINLVSADSYTIVAGTNFVPAANFRATNAISVLAGGDVDLSLLSLVSNLNNKTPSIIAKSYKAPQP
jgi:filamentous hemagglutinin family protein